MTTEKPILFKGEMVRAILDGRKTQTRRPVQLPKDGLVWRWDGAWVDSGFEDTGQYMHIQFRCKSDPWEADPRDQTLHRVGCPYGFPGDKLWVRETFAYYPDEKHVIYAASEGDELAAGGTNLKGCWKPSIFMPRWASRITLEITEVRVQRVQEITAADAIAEGILVDDRQLRETPNFRQLWDSINAKRGFGWKENPWCWCLTFKRIKP